LRATRFVGDSAGGVARSARVFQFLREVSAFRVAKKLSATALLSQQLPLRLVLTVTLSFAKWAGPRPVCDFPIGAEIRFPLGVLQLVELACFEPARAGFVVKRQVFQARR